MSYVSHDCDHEASDGARIVMTNMYDKRRLLLTPVSSSEPDVHWAEIGKKKYSSIIISLVNNFSF